MNYEDKMRAGLPMETVDAAAHRPRLADVVGNTKDAFRRHWLAFLLTTIGVLAAALVLILLIAPKYEAATRVRIDPTGNPLVTSQGEAMATLSSEAIDTEVGMLRSAELAQEVARRLNLWNDPEFTRGLDDGPPLSQQERLTAVTNRLRERVAVGRERLTYIIAISARSNDADKAARIANTFAEAYLDLRVGTGVGTAERQAQWFRDRLNELGSEVQQAEARLAQYRASAGLPETAGSGSVTDQQIAPLSNELANAEAQAAAARASLEVAQAQISRGGLDSVSEVRTSPVIADLRRQRAEVLRNQGEIMARYGERHPEMIRVRDQLESLDRQIREEAERAIGSLRASASAAEARVGSLRASLGRLQGAQAQETRASGVAASLERDVATRRAAYERMSQLSLQSTQGAQNNLPQAVVVERATPPNEPTEPNRRMLAVLALVVALAAGLAAVIILEMMSNGMRSIADIQNRFGIPVLAAIPRIENRRMLRQVRTPADLVIQQPASAYSESLRNLRASLIGVRGASDVRVVAFTSALPEEGKTTASLSMARVLAMAGTKTLLIDCDMRRASLGPVTVGSPEFGLVEVLNGKASPEQAVNRDQVEHLDLIVVRQPVFDSQETFLEALERLLAWARQHYSVIVLDLPPILGVADARAMAAAADRVALIVKWSSTPAKAVETALSMLRADDAPLSGAVYTMVSPKAEGVGGLSYAGRYSAYYQSA